MYRKARGFNTRQCLVWSVTVAFGCSSTIDQSRGSGVHRTSRGVDSEGDEYEDDQEILDDSENSEDSDPELDSPRLIRQTNLSMYKMCVVFLSVD